MNREVHVRFWERAEVKFLRATRHFQPRQPRLASGLMSAAGLIAAVRSTDAGSSISAITGREQMQQTMCANARLLDRLVSD
jgi:hypothetical protein